MSTAGHKNVYRCWNPINVGAGWVASVCNFEATQFKAPVAADCNMTITNAAKALEHHPADACRGSELALRLGSVYASRHKERLISTTSFTHHYCRANVLDCTVDKRREGI